MPTNFPTSLDTTTNLPTTIADATTQATNHPAYHNTEDGALIAIETKVGIGASTPTSGLVMTGGVTPGTSSWQAGSGHSHTQQWQATASFYMPAAGDLVTAGRIAATTTPTAFWCRRTGGTGATVDVKKNGTTMLTAALSLTTTAWTSGTFTGSPTLAAGDTVEFDIITATGGPSEVVLTLDGTRAIT